MDGLPQAGLETGVDLNRNKAVGVEIVGVRLGAGASRDLVEFVEAHGAVEGFKGLSGLCVPPGPEMAKALQQQRTKSRFCSFRWPRISITRASFDTKTDIR